MTHAEFQTEMFRCWLNRVDARIGYDARRDLGSVNSWRGAFNLGWSEDVAVADFRAARDARAFCNVEI